LSKNRRENGLTRDQPVPSNPFFSAPCSTASGSNNRPVNAPQITIQLAGINVCCAESLQYRINRAIAVPFIE
jgi:hypothetical protein